MTDTKSVKIIFEIFIVLSNFKTNLVTYAKESKKDECR